MNTVFRTVLRARVLHDFYKDSACTDFELFPVSDTKQLMRNRQMVFSFKDTFCTLMIQEDSTGVTAAHPLESDDAIVLGMALTNPALGNFTSEWPGARKAFLFTNTDNLTDPAVSPVTLSRTEISICGKTLVHTIVSALAVTLELKNEKGITVSSSTRTAGSDGKEQLFDLSLHPNGLYTVTETAGMVSVNYLYYSDQELSFRNLFGIIRIVNQNTFPFSYDGKPDYRVELTSKSSAWKYYVVAPGLSGSDISTNLNITDTGRTGPAVIVFDKTYPVPPGDTVAPLLCTDTSKVALFTSTTALAFQQQPRKQIELRKGATALISNLPNPDVRKPTPEMYIYV